LSDVVTRLAIAGSRGLGAWLLMDSVDTQRAVSERGREQEKQAVLDERAARWEAERRARDEKMRVKQAQRDEKARQQTRKERMRQWRRLRHALTASGPLAWLKGGLKLLIGARHQ
jgi:hypothetical protein